MKGARARGDVLVANSCEALTNLVGRYNLARLRSREIKSRQLNGPALCRAAEPTYRVVSPLAGYRRSVVEPILPPNSTSVPNRSMPIPTSVTQGGWCVGSESWQVVGDHREASVCMHEPSGVGAELQVRRGYTRITSEYASIPFARKSGEGTMQGGRCPPA